MKESRTRTIVKSFSWRLVASFTTALLVLIFTGSWTLSIGIGSFEIISKMILYFFHERIWNRIIWGKVK